jgi:hypothetical protein
MALVVVPSLPRSLLAPCGQGLLVGLMTLSMAGLGLQAQPLPGLVALECRLDEGPWQNCQMQVEQIGAHWFLLVGGQRIEFRHDGRGSVTMQKPSGGWRPVSSRWQEDTSLCWDGVCARGDIPLD